MDVQGDREVMGLGVRDKGLSENCNIEDQNVQRDIRKFLSDVNGQTEGKERKFNSCKLKG